MKKLCTYLTLFVLGLLAFAQPAAAAGFTKGTVYYIDASAYANTISSIVVWDGTADVTASVVSGKIYSYKQSADNTGSVYVKRDGSQSDQVQVNGPSDSQENCIKLNSSWNSYEWTTYSPQGPTDYTFYVDASAANWQNVYLRLWNGNETWKGTGTRYLEPTETLSNGVKKFVVEGVTQVGEMMFRSVNSDTAWDAGNESKDISTPTNGALYTLTTKDTDNNNKWNTTVTENYEEPEVNPTVEITPNGGSFVGSTQVTISATPDGAKIYYTTDGSDPVATGTSYDSPATLTLTADATVKAIAVFEEKTTSVASATFTKTNYAGALYAKGPACNNNWNTWAQLTGTDGVFSFDIIAQGEFLITDSNSDAGIYSLDGASSIPEGKANAAKIKREQAGNFSAPAATGKIFIDMNDLKIWYEPKQEVLPTALWAKGPGASGAWDKTIKLESDGDGLFYFTAYAADEFVISDTDNLGNDGSGNSIFDKTAWGPVATGVVAVPTEMPETANVEHAQQFGNNFKATGTNVIYFDVKNLKIWSGERVEPTLYTFYVKVADEYTAWGEDKCYLYTFNEDGDEWTSVGGQCVKFDRRLSNGIYKFIVRGQTKVGRMLFKNTAGTSDMQEYSGTILPANIKPGNLYTIGAKGEAPAVTENYVESNVFEAGKAYYVDASGCSWFENDGCTLGVKYNNLVHSGGTFVKVSASPLVYRFTVNEDQTEIQVGRSNDKGFHNAVTVQAPTDGSNCIYVKNDNGVLVFDRWDTYVPATANQLYILGSSDAIEGDWKSATPIAMNYDEENDIYYYLVQGTNASPAHPIEFTISRGSTNSTFFNAANAFMPVRAGYIHMAESDYMKGKPGYEDGNYFKLLSRGRVIAKYMKDENDVPTGIKVWYEPIVWPDLYALGSIIAKPGDKKAELGDQTSQWHTFVKLEKAEEQPGLYYYDLGINGNTLFNEEAYNTEGVFGKIDEHGHFNFSFISGTDTNEFWKDAFVPATSTSMGTLNRDGVPVPFCYRDSKPGEDAWVSTNFVFGERSRIWVDVVRQIVWVETFTELSGNQAVFDFWDKGGSAYSKEDGYQWWSATDATTHNVQAYLVDAEGNTVSTNDSPYTLKASDLNWQALEVIDNVGCGVRYHFVANLPESYYEKDGEGNVTDKVANGYHVWIRIADNSNAAHEILRPYAYQATYTQGLNGDVNYNHYGNVIAKGDPIVDIKPSVSMIYADVEAADHMGRTRADQIMHYPFVNQFTTAVTVNSGDVYPFYMEGVTKPRTIMEGESEVEVDGEYVPVPGATVVFAKSNQVTVNYGTIKETRTGSTGEGLIKGIDHANAAEDDNMEVRVTYKSEGLIFARTKVEPLKLDANELPTMQTSESHDLGCYGFYGSHCSEGVALDILLDQEFDFRDIMTQGDDKYNARAAYLGYEITLEKENDHSHVAEGNEHVAANGRPLIWDFADDKNNSIAAYDADNWHYEAFTRKRLPVQLHHVLCGANAAALKGKQVKGSITFHLYVPVATEFSFETGTTSLPARGMYKAAPATNANRVDGDPSNPYTGSVSAKTYGSFTKEFTFDVDKNVTTGVEGVNVEDATEAPVEFYNLQGVRMNAETLAPGVYIRRQGNETTKVYIR